MKKILIAYFSASGQTKKVAQKLAKVTGGDLFEIMPAKPYTDADLDWTNSRSRSSIECADRSSRPPLAFKADLSGYDTIFLGFPIWWYRQPPVIDTFVEEHDFAGKTIVPFATSGSSGMGDSDKNIQALAKGGLVKKGKRLPLSISEADLKIWAESQM